MEWPSILKKSLNIRDKPRFLFHYKVYQHKFLNQPPDTAPAHICFAEGSPTSTFYYYLAAHICENAVKNNVKELHILDLGGYPFTNSAIPMFMAFSQSNIQVYYTTISMYTVEKQSSYLEQNRVHFDNLHLQFIQADVLKETEKIKQILLGKQFDVFFSDIDPHGNEMQIVNSFEEYFKDVCCMFMSCLGHQYTPLGDKLILQYWAQISHFFLFDGGARFDCCIILLDKTNGKQWDQLSIYEKCLMPVMVSPKRDELKQKGYYYFTDEDLFCVACVKYTPLVLCNDCDYNYCDLCRSIYSPSVVHKDIHHLFSFVDPLLHKVEQSISCCVRHPQQTQLCFSSPSYASQVGCCRAQKVK